MNSAADAAAGLGPRPARSPGWRLLSHRRRPTLLRWALDPDSPDPRELAAGELRLAIVGLDLNGGVWPGVPCGGRRGRPHDRDDEVWRPLLARGEARVVESAEPAWPVGRLLRGLMPVSTHVVVDAAPAWQALPRDDDAGQDAPLLQALGIDEVERRVRRSLGDGDAGAARSHVQAGCREDQVGLLYFSGTNRLPCPPNQNQRLLSPT